MLHQRFDRTVPVLLRPQKNPDGSMWFEGRAASAGIYTYYDANGTAVRELVDSDVLLDKESLATLGGATVTLRHPADGFVTPDNYDLHAVGHVGSVVEKDDEGGFVIVKTRVHRRDALKSIDEHATLELSCGYEALVDKTPGEHPTFGKYDQRQVSRIYNHLALVPDGRHGPNVSIRADACVMRLDGAPEWTLQHEDSEMTEEQLKQILGKLDALTEAQVKHGAAIEALQARSDKSEDHEPDEKVDHAALRASAKRRVRIEDAATRAGIEFKDDSTDSDLIRSILIKSDARLETGLKDTTDATLDALWLLHQSKTDESGTEGWKLDEGSSEPVVKTDSERIPFIFEAEAKADAFFRRGESEKPFDNAVL